MGGQARQRRGEDDDGARPLNEVKLLLLGQPRAGKTSLAKRLVSNDFNLDEDETLGIEHHKWKVGEGDAQVRVNLWDFGGQEMMLATHQFFLTKRSVYLVVVDASAKDPQIPLEHWLKRIRSFAKGSPVLVVCNKADEGIADLPRRRLRDKYPDLLGFYEISCKTQGGLPALRAAIEEHIAGFAPVHETIPGPWLRVKQKLEKMRRRYMKLEELEALCDQEGVDGADGRRKALDLLHDIGTIVSFHEDSHLRDTAVLDPAWITEGVYKIVFWREIHARDGVLEVDNLRRLLRSDEYPLETHAYLVRIMKKFELCFPFDEGAPPERCLFPGLLPVEVDVPRDGPLVLAYEYEQLLESVLHRFMVRTYHLIPKGLCWRLGAVLERDGCRAHVQGDTTYDRVEIRVGGPPAEAKILVALIRDHFDALHALPLYQGTLPKAKIFTDVGGMRVAVDHADVMALRRLGHTTTIVPGTEATVSIDDLLGEAHPVAPAEKKPAKARRERPRSHALAVICLVIAPLSFFLGAAFAAKIAGEHAVQALVAAVVMAVVIPAGYLAVQRLITGKQYKEIVSDALRTLRAVVPWGKKGKG